MYQEFKYIGYREKNINCAYSMCNDQNKNGTKKGK